MKVGVVATTIFACLIGLPIASFAGLAPDTDSDGAPNVLDNCDNLANTVPAGANCDANSDGYGNKCDCDLDDNGSCSITDVSLFKTAYNAKNNSKADFNCSLGATSLTDVSLFKAAYNGKTPLLLYHSGLSCAGTVPCVP